MADGGRSVAFGALGQGARRALSELPGPAAALTGLPTADPRRMVGGGVVRPEMIGENEPWGFHERCAFVGLSHYR